MEVDHALGAARPDGGVGGIELAGPHGHLAALEHAVGGVGERALRPWWVKVHEAQGGAAPQGGVGRTTDHRACRRDVTGLHAARKAWQKDQSNPVGWRSARLWGVPLHSAAWPPTDPAWLSIQTASTSAAPLASGAT